MNKSQPFQLGAWLQTRTGFVTVIFLLIAAFYLITEHTAHVFGVLPYALLLLCPLLHLFMHGGHAGHTSEDKSNGSPSDDAPRHVH
ncbi:MAG: DUF2933 domain-containing protein [Anaerolineae bacterium]|nr:DUF2933 domain-containing protein [Anaerolineae bacterium]